LNNIILSLTTKFNQNQGIIYLLLGELAKEYFDQLDIDDFCLAFHQDYSKTSSPLSKKLLVHALVGISSNCSSKIFEKYVYPLFVSLSEDSHWGVRKACAEAISDFTASVVKHNKDFVVKMLVIVDNLIKDASKWVKNKIFSEFGKFIYQISLHNQADFSKNIDKLIINYIEEGKNEDLEEPELINHSIAFNMP